jgi:molybdate transport system regulatory protein
MAALSVRIGFDPDGKIGPGKIRLLEEIGACGSISAAGRRMSMSYRRAWELVEELNRIFATPVVARQVGGKNGGGATLTSLGIALVNHYRAIEAAAQDIARSHLEELQKEVTRSLSSES